MMHGKNVFIQNVGHRIGLKGRREREVWEVRKGVGGEGRERRGPGEVPQFTCVT